MLHTPMYTHVEVIDGQFKLVSLRNRRPMQRKTSPDFETPASIHAVSAHMSWCLTPKLKRCVRAYVRVELGVRGNLKNQHACAIGGPALPN
jgi:hypothetical protein